MKTNRNMLTSRLRDVNDSFFTDMKILPNPDKILSQTAGGSYVAFRDLESDAHLWSCIQSRKSGCTSRRYSIVSGDDADEKLNAEVQQMLSETDIYELFDNILEAPLFGFQPLEIIWQTEKSGTEIRILPKEIIPRKQELFCFTTDGELLIRSATGEPAEIPKYKVLCPRYEAGAGNPYGHSLLSKCYWHVMFKTSGTKNWVKFSEKYGMPILIGQYTRGCSAEEAGHLADALCSMTEDSVIVSPSDIKIALREASQTSSGDLYSGLIEHCNAEISKAILSQTLTTELSGGSYAASQTHYKVRQEIILADSKLIEKTMDQLIRYYVEVNYGNTSKALPHFRLHPADDDLADKLEGDLKIAKESGYRLSKNYLERTYGFGAGDLESVG